MNISFMISVGYSSAVSRQCRDCSCRCKARKNDDGGLTLSPLRMKVINFDLAFQVYETEEYGISGFGNTHNRFVDNKKI